MPRRVTALQEFLSTLEGLVEAAAELSTLASIARLYLATIKLHDKLLPEVLCSEDEAWSAYFVTGRKLNEIIGLANEAGLRGPLHGSGSNEHPAIEGLLGRSTESTALFADCEWDQKARLDVLDGLFKLNRATYFKSWMPLLGSRSPIGARGLLREAIQGPALVCTQGSTVRSARGKLLERSTLPETAKLLRLDLSEWTLLDLAQARRQTLLRAGFHAAKGWEAGSAKELAKGIQTLDDFLRFFRADDAPVLECGCYYEALDGSWTYASIIRELEHCVRVSYLKNTEGDLIAMVETREGKKILLRTFPSPSSYAGAADTPGEMAKFEADPLSYIVAHRRDFSMGLQLVAACRGGIAALRPQVSTATVAAPLFGLAGIAAGKIVGAQLFPGLAEPIIEALVGAIGLVLGWSLFQQPELVFSGWSWEEELASTIS